MSRPGHASKASKTLACGTSRMVVASRRMTFRIPALLLVIGSLLAEQTEGPQAFTREINLPVPMRDGVELRADVLRPPQSAKFPVLVYRTPYGKDAAQQEYTTFRHAVERGYAV